MLNRAEETESFLDQAAGILGHGERTDSDLFPNVPDFAFWSTDGKTCAVGDFGRRPKVIIFCPDLTVTLTGARVHELRECGRQAEQPPAGGADAAPR